MAWRPPDLPSPSNPARALPLNSYAVRRSVGTSVTSFPQDLLPMPPILGLFASEIQAPKIFSSRRRISVPFAHPRAIDRRSLFGVSRACTRCGGRHHPPCCERQTTSDQRRVRTAVTAGQDAVNKAPLCAATHPQPSSAGNVLAARQQGTSTCNHSWPSPNPSLQRTLPE